MTYTDHLDLPNSSFADELPCVDCGEMTYADEARCEECERYRRTGEK